MSDSLAELLRRSADAVPEPDLDVGRLVAEAGRRQRRHRLGAVAATTVLVAVTAVGTYAVLDGEPRELDPSRPPSNVVEPPRDDARPLVYAAGSTVHVGDRTVDAGARVMFVDVTDDGVVYMTDADDRLWFDDGSTAEVIGVVPTPHVGSYPEHTGDSGSLVVWPDGTSADSRLVVYDTSRHDALAGPKGFDLNVLRVDERYVYTSPDWSNTPGCWIIDQRPCPDPHLLRYDAASGRTEEITRRAYETETRADPRMFVGARTSDETGTGLDAGAGFTLAGPRLVPTDDDGRQTRLALTNGAPVQLRVPVADAGAWGGFWVAQWLDDDRVVLAGYQGDFDGVGQGDSYPASYVDLLVCRLPDGVCRVAVPRSTAAPYLLTGQRNFP